MAARNLIVLLALLCALVCPARGDDGGVKPGRWKIKGMAFGTGHDLESIHEPYAQKSLNLLKTTNINYIHVSAYGKMKTKWSLTYKMETDDDSIRFQIRMHKRNGLKVLFKPVLEIKNDVWRGFIPNRHKFMYATYGPFISKMARIAEEEKVDLFAVGSEYKQTLPNRIAWRWVIRRVRSIYKGRVTYVANHDTYHLCKFWDLVDLISVSAYFPLVQAGGATYGASPSLHETRMLWEKKAAKLNQWRTEMGFSGKNVLIAEVGFQSKGGGVVYRKPYNWKVAAGVDEWEQAKMYEGLLSAFMPKPWCAGVILWNWEIHPYANTREPGPRDYTPQNKMAMHIMKRHFAKW